ncbi:MAG TPA: methyltransferase domain-containing protein [Thermoanaerobaculia bacterium]|nr:methyltransferase domain-containing protein [Thermoanaerobaculia bacterium]
MLMYGWMKFVEIAPGRYDWAVKVMTGGRIDAIKARIASQVRDGDRVLDIGCGTGTLAVRCLERGALVTGLDSNEHMLAQAAKNARRAGFEDRLSLVRDSVTQLAKHFPDHSFDVITSTMALGEFPREYLDFILKDCRRLLRPGGRLLIADEVWPERRWVRLLYQLGMVLLWVPQFLLLRRALFPIDNLRGVIQAAGFTVEKVETWAASSFQLVDAHAS